MTARTKRIVFWLAVVGVVAVVVVAMMFLHDRRSFIRSDGYRVAEAHLASHPYLLQSLGAPLSLHLGLVFGYYEGQYDGPHRCVAEFSVYGPQDAGVAVVHLSRGDAGWEVSDAFFTSHRSRTEVAITKSGHIMPIHSRDCVKSLPVWQVRR